MHNIYRLTKIIFLTVMCFCLCSCSSKQKHTGNENISITEPDKPIPGKNNSDTSSESDDSHGSDKITENSGNKSTREPNTPVNNATGAYVDILNSNLTSSSPNMAYAFSVFGEDVSYISSNEKFESASIIKLFIAEYAFSLIESGSLTPDSTVSGSKLISLIEKMITISDNNSTNILIDHFKAENLNAYFAEKGYKGTSLGRKMLDFKAKANGNDNYTTAGDVLKFLNNLYSNRDKSPQKDLLEIMKKQTICTKIRKNLPPETVIANKTGELSDVENDAGIIFTPKGDFALVVLTNKVSSPANARETIAKSARDIYDMINK